MSPAESQMYGASCANEVGIPRDLKRRCADVTFCRASFGGAFGTCRETLLVLAGHLAGTFLSFVTASELMWGANIFELTADGEFVLKNVVLISAALLLIATYGPRTDDRATA